MKLPSPVDYTDAVANPRVVFLDPILAASKIRTSGMGMPIAASGGFALTFDASTSQGRFAVRCFHKHAEHLQDRYAAISRFITANPTGFLADVDYQRQGIRVLGATYPLVKMRWIEGERLDAWLEDRSTDSRAVAKVRSSLNAAATELQRMGVAHGDLQHGNILIRPTGDVTLVDYDGMYLSPLEKLGTAEYGHRNYQHPKRMNRYDASLDVFSAFLIDLSLRAIERQPSLFARFGEGENLLFSARDFLSPAGSPVFSLLGSMPGLQTDTSLLARSCTMDYPDAIALLSGGRTATARQTTQQIRREDLLGASAVSALDRKTLLQRVGDEVTVVGRLTTFHTGLTKRGNEYSFLNFGNRSFTIVCWSRVRAELNKRIAIEDLSGRWVRVTGTIQLFRGSPQIQLERESQLHLETAERIEALLREGMAPRPTPTTNPTRQRTTQAGPSPRVTPRPSAATGPSSFVDDFEAWRRTQQPQQPTKRPAASQPPAAPVWPPPPQPTPWRPPASPPAREPIAPPAARYSRENPPAARETLFLGAHQTFL